MPGPPADAAATPTGDPARSPGVGLVLTLAAGVVVAAATSVVVLAVLARLPVPDPIVSTANAGLTTLAIVVALAALGLSVALARRSGLVGGAGTVGTWASLSALVTVTLGVPLARTPLYLGGVTTDQVFRNQLLNRLTDSPALSDMNYANLAPYYPSGWFWIGGRAADLLGRTGWETYKPYAIATFAVAAVVSLVLWTVVLPTLRATAVATVATLVVLGGEGVTEPYGASVALLGGPVLVLAWRGLAAERGSGRGDLLTAGLFLGLFATFYTLYFGVFALSIAAMAGLLALLRRPGLGVVRLVGRLLVIAVPAGLVALVVWAPYVLSVLAGAPSSGAAQHYLPAIGTDLPLPMTRFTLLGAITLVGTAWVLLRARVSSVAAALGTSVVVCLAWSVLSLVMVMLGTTLLGFRLEVPIDALLAAAGVLGLAEAAGLVSARLRERAAPGRTTVPGALAPRTVAVVLTGLATLALAQEAPATLTDQVRVAYADPLPGDPRASGNAAAATYPEVDRLVSSALPGPRRDTVLLTTDHVLLAFYPYRGFQQFTPHYANPHARYTERNDLIRSWAQSRSPQELLAALDASPYAPPRAFYLDRDGADYGVTLAEDVFPAEPNVKYTDVRFPASLFDDPAFTVTEVGSRVVITRTG